MAKSGASRSCWEHFKHLRAMAVKKNTELSNSFSDESKIMIGHDSRVYVWRNKDAGWRLDLVTPRQRKPCY